MRKAICDMCGVEEDVSYVDKGAIQLIGVYREVNDRMAFDLCKDCYLKIKGQLVKEP